MIMINREKVQTLSIAGMFVMAVGVIAYVIFSDGKPMGSDDDGETVFIYPYGGDAPTPDNGEYTVSEYCLEQKANCGIIHFSIHDGTDLKVKSELTGLDADSQPSGWNQSRELYSPSGSPPLCTSMDQKTDYEMISNDAVDYVVPAPCAFRLHIKMGNKKHRTLYVTKGCRLELNLHGSMDNGGTFSDPVMTNIPEMTPNGTMEDSQGNPCGQIDE